MDEIWLDMCMHTAFASQLERPREGPTSQVMYMYVCMHACMYVPQTAGERYVRIIMHTYSTAAAAAAAAATTTTTLSMHVFKPNQAFWKTIIARMLTHFAQHITHAHNQTNKDPARILTMRAPWPQQAPEHQRDCLSCNPPQGHRRPFRYFDDLFSLWTTYAQAHTHVCA